METQVTPRGDQRPAYVIRPGKESDEGYIAKTWLGAWHAGAPVHRYIDMGRVQRSIYPLVEEVLKRAEVRVLAPRHDSTTIWGFAVLEPGLIHMVYVAKHWRRMGLARELLKDVDLSESAWSTQTQDYIAWIRHKCTLKEYRPFWLVERRAANG